MWEVEVSYAARLRRPNHNFAQLLPFLTVLKQNVGSWGFYANHDGIQTSTLKAYCFLGYQKVERSWSCFMLPKKELQNTTSDGPIDSKSKWWCVILAAYKNSTSHNLFETCLAKTQLSTYDTVFNATGESMTNNWLCFLLVANKTSTSHQLFKIIETGRGCGKAWCVILMSGAYANFNFPKGRLRLGSAGAVRSCGIFILFRLA